MDDSLTIYFEHDVLNILVWNITQNIIWLEKF